MKYLYYKTYQSDTGRILSKIDGKRWRELKKLYKVKTYGNEVGGDQELIDGIGQKIAFRTAA